MYTSVDFTTKSAKNNDYTSTWDYGDWKLFGANNFNGEWGYIRMGGKNLTNEDRTITGTVAIDAEITKVVVNHNGVSNKNLVVNSVAVTAASDADFTQNVVTTTVSDPEVSAEGSIELVPRAAFAANSYFKIVVNVTNSNNKNYGLDVTKVEFYKESSATDKPVSQISFPENSYTVTLGDEFTAPELTITAGDGEISYKSSDEKVATVEFAPTGAPTVNIIGAGETTITATIAETDNYKGAKASYTLTVNKRVVPVTYYKVNSPAQLVDGKQYILVYENGEESAAMGDIVTYGQNDVGSKIDATINGNEVVVDESEINELTLGIVDNGYTFQANSGAFLSWSSGNTLTQDKEVNDASTWTIDDYFTIANVGDPARKLQYNSTNPRFACYGNTNQKPIAIYAKEQPEGATLSVSVGAEGFATFTAPFTVNVPEDSEVKAYVASGSDEITLEKVNVVVKGQGVLLHGEPNATAEWGESAEGIVFSGENLFVGVTREVASLASVNERTGDTFFILNVGSLGIGFYAAGGQSVPAGKAYLKVPATAGAKGYISINFGEVATGISELKAQPTENTIFNLNGVRVKDMNQKGVYIVNGKKVVKK
ncbi:MAG: hypothetical protein IJ562_04430 [Prevotella sp.]|nr:hypothetical protein [Prevotella sp.]